MNNEHYPSPSAKGDGWSGVLFITHYSLLIVKGSFTMGKMPEKKYYAIGEVSKLTEVKPHILRYWEDEFPLLRPKKNRAGNRAYRTHDLKVVFLIKRLLREEHYTAEAALAKLKENRDFVRAQLDRPIEDWIAPTNFTDRMKQDLHVLLKMIEQC